MNHLHSLIAPFVLSAACGCASEQERQNISTVKCDSAKFQEFDFWLGDWDIKQRILSAEGDWLELPARTHVVKSADGCTITENWSGDVEFFWDGMTAPEPMWGYSVRRYDPVSSRWAIYWMDERKPDFGAPMVGGFTDMRGEFFRNDGDDKRARIVFERGGGNEVFWELAVSSDAGATFAPIWTMEMRRKR